MTEHLMLSALSLWILQVVKQRKGGKVKISKIKAKKVNTRCKIKQCF